MTHTARLPRDPRVTDKSVVCEGGLVSRASGGGHAFAANGPPIDGECGWKIAEQCGGVESGRRHGGKRVKSVLSILPSLCVFFSLSAFSVFLCLSRSVCRSDCRACSIFCVSTCVQTRSHQQQPPVSHAPHALARTHARTHLHAHTPGPHWRAVASAHHTLSLLRKRSGTLGSLSTAMISLRTVDLSGLAVPAIISSKVDARPSPATTHLGRARASRRQQQPVTARRGGGG